MFTTLLVSLGLIAQADDHGATGTNRAFTHTTTTAAPPEVIWALWTDVPGWPTWDTEMTAATLDTPLALHASGTVTSGGRVSPFTITRWEPGQAYAFAIPLPLGQLIIDRILRPLPGGGTQFTHTVSLTGVGGFLLGNSLGRSFRQALPDVMRQLADIAESRTR